MTVLEVVYLDMNSRITVYDFKILHTTNTRVIKTSFV